MQVKLFVYAECMPAFWKTSGVNELFSANQTDSASQINMLFCLPEYTQKSRCVGFIYIISIGYSQLNWVTVTD